MMRTVPWYTKASDLLFHFGFESFGVYPSNSVTQVLTRPHISLFSLLNLILIVSIIIIFSLLLMHMVY